MPKLSDLVAEKAKAELQVGGATVNITFYVMIHERFSEDEWSELIAVHDAAVTKRLLPKVLISWDVVDDSGTMIPLSAEAFDQYEVPDILLFAIERRIFSSDLAGKVVSSSN